MRISYRRKKYVKELDKHLSPMVVSFPVSDNMLYAHSPNSPAMSSHCKGYTVPMPIDILKIDLSVNSDYGDPVTARGIVHETRQETPE